jgi:NAD(P)-dependent dehydrogenase (short-subunit alcohol dehydrogenase family)
MDLELKGKRAVVTGSSSGIGAGIAATLAAEGAHVAVHGRDRDRTEKVVGQIRAAGGKAFPVIGDIATDDGGQAVAKSAFGELGGVDVLVNVVGGPGEGALTWDNTSTEQWAEQYQMNTMSAVRMIHHFLPGMKERRWGRVINIASIAGIRPFPEQVPAYVASKAGLIATGISLALTVADTGVTVNTISPGFIATDGLKAYVMASPGSEGKTWEELEPGVAAFFKCRVGRLGKPKDIGNFVAYLASPLAEWITGSHFRIDGGTADWVG